MYVKRKDPKCVSLMDLPSYYAELLINGHAVELLDGEGTRPTINAIWFTAICDRIIATFPNLRVFVVSIIGLQSSGKSTLLNALFGCKFAVSVGRCTRGLFLRLLFLEEELRDQLKADAIIVIDMEGLGSPEKVNDPEFEKKDRLMTTFVMGISNMTLINISGESSNTMTDILQIAIVSMAKLKDDKLSTDMFVVQYLSERNPQRVSLAHGEFIKAIEKAIDLTGKEGVYIGIQNCECMKNLMSRAKKGNVLKAFGPFRNGDNVNSPPSVGYHESVVDLYKSILEACKDCDAKLTLDVWSRMLEGYLDSVVNEDVVVRFKNLIEMCEHLERGNRISETKEAIEKAFRQHVSAIEPEIRREIQVFQENNPQHQGNPESSVHLEKQLTEKVRKTFDLVPKECNSEQDGKNVCNSCERATTVMNMLFEYVRGKSVEEDTISTIRKFVETTKESNVKRMENMIGAELLKQGYFKEFHEIINQALAGYSLGEKKRSEEECLEIADSIWKEVDNFVTQKYSYTTIQQRIRRDIAEVYHAFADACERYAKEEVVSLDTKLAYRKKWSFGMNMLQASVKPLDPKMLSEIKGSLGSLPFRFVKRNNIKRYCDDAIVSVHQEIEETIKKFESKKRISFLDEYKLELHLFALKKFGLLMHLVEETWAKDNHEKPDHPALQERITKSIEEVYDFLPNASNRYANPQEVLRLDNPLAYSDAGIFSSHLPNEYQPLNKQDLSKLKNSLNQLPKNFAQLNNIEHYSDGIMVSIRNEIEDVITEFESKANITLLGDYKWEVHLYALKKFGSLFHQLEGKWEAINHPQKMLEGNKEVYMEMILTRLRHGFSASGEGHVISNLLLKALAQKASTHGSETRVDKVLALPWISNAENVRLRFYNILARQVEEGDFDEAIEYFTSPEEKITQWFRKEVDSNYADVCARECEKTFESELKTVIQEVRNKRTMGELKKYLDDYFTQFGTVIYQSSLQDENVKGVNFDMMKASVEQGIRDRRESLLPQLQVKNPSEADRVMARLGCTQSCYWCGALCWGQRGHHTNQDDTKNHHACHQPGGLIVVQNVSSGALCSESCHDVRDAQKVNWGEGFTTWEQAKKHGLFKNWLFEKHAKDKFNQLMHWFFKKLNTQLARRFNQKPAPESELRGGAYANLNSITLDEILEAIPPQVLSS